MAKYLQNSSDIEIEEVTGTENIKFNFTNNNSIDAKIGNLSNLQTSDKTNVVSAINDCIDSGNYSTSEVKTNKVWIDGKPIYRKVIDFGYLPNSTTAEISSGLTNVVITNMYGVAVNSSNATLTIPEANGVNSIRLVYTSDNKVQVGTTYDRSSFYAYAILEYTKTID